MSAPGQLGEDGHLGEGGLSADAAYALTPGGSALRMALRRFLHQRLAVASLCLLIVFALAALAAPLIELLLGVDGNRVDLYNRLAGPSLAHPLGTDDLGRDLLVRMLYGARVSLAVGLATAVCAAAIGLVVGLLAGYYGGRFDALLMRLTDGIIALPLLPLLIVLAAVDLGKLGVPESVATSQSANIYRMVAIIALIGWTTVARLVRAATLSMKTRDFVRAAQSLGAGPGRIMRVHILPNVASPLIVATTLSVGNVILLESVLSFLGLGIQPPLASWGNMLTGAQELLYTAPMQAVWPGLAIFLTVIACNLLGDGLQDAFDPRSERGPRRWRRWRIRRKL